MLFRRKIHLPYQPTIPIGSKWIEIWGQNLEKIDPYQAICGIVSNVGELMIHLDSDFHKIGIDKHDFLRRYRRL